MSIWNNVKTKMPSNQEPVLVYTGKSMRVASHNYEGWMLEGSFHEYDISDDEWDYDGIWLKYITHWMPLPEAPKKKPKRNES